MGQARIHNNWSLGDSAMSSVTTRTDPTAAEWSISDEVIRLRRWGTHEIHVLPPPPVDRWLIGTTEICSLTLADQLVSREHACLIRQHGRWSIRDLGSKNGLRRDGAHTDQFALAPGIEIGIGGTTLIAESRQSIALHGFLARILGWGSDRIDTVDHALRSVRMSATRRTALVLADDSDLVPIAYAIHRHTLGADRPFVVSDPHRKTQRESVRSAANHVRGMPAFEAATGGSLCVRSSRLPVDFASVLARIRKPEARVQLIICTQNHKDNGAFLTIPIHVPPLGHRAHELGRIVDEYALDAAALLGVPPESFTSADREWVLRHGASSLSEIEKATLRLVALRISRNRTRAAERLGMAPVSLTRWIGRRKPPMLLE
jgi:Inner membrane component of T3SS, cytoplasmic domain